MSDTWYRDIAPLQEPFDIGLEEGTKRAQCAFNVLVTKRPSDSFLLELLGILEAASVGTANVNMFASSAATIPAGDGPILSIRPTGGAAPLGTHNAGVGAYRRPSAQIVVRASRYADAEAMALRAYEALIAIRNRTVSA